MWNSFGLDAKAALLSRYIKRGVSIDYSSLIYHVMHKCQMVGHTFSKIKIEIDLFILEANVTRC